MAVFVEYVYELGGLRKWSRRNTQLDDAIGADAAEGISNKALARRYQCSESTVERVIHRCYDEILRRRSKHLLPQVLGIDEYSIHMGRTRAGCVKPLRELKRCDDELLHDAPAPSRKLGHTLREWFAPIIRMWRLTRHNTITEGFHRKMKLIQRRAYGFRNFGNYRLRILVECGHR